jgi:hypothetical protein
MLQDTCEDSKTDGQAGREGHPRTRGCASFKTLQTWQIRRYRRAVEENKWYLSEKTGRDVGWDEAEHDFLINEYYGCAPKWRKEYCASKCNHFTDCSLGQHFCRET